MQKTGFDNINVAKVKHQANCITCAMKHRRHLKNVILPVQVVINMQINELCFYSFLCASHYNEQTKADCG